MYLCQQQTLTIMRKILLLLLILPFLFACSSDDDEEVLNYDIKPLIGAWYQNEYNPAISWGNSYIEFFPDTTLTTKTFGASSTTINYNRIKFWIRGNGIHIYKNEVPSWKYEIIDANHINITQGIREPFDKHSLHNRVESIE